MFVAVVYKMQDDTYPLSHKPDGDYACFVADTKELASALAIKAVLRWEGNHPDPFGKESRKYYGPYEVLVGELTEMATLPIQFTKVEEF